MVGAQTVLGQPLVGRRDRSRSISSGELYRYHTMGPGRASAPMLAADATPSPIRCRRRPILNPNTW